MFLHGEKEPPEQKMLIIFTRSASRRKTKFWMCAEKSGLQAVATIGSDLANITVQYLAEKLGLPGNSRECIENSTNKFKMREAFARAGIWVPFFAVAGENDKISVQESGYPVIVKPTDRSAAEGSQEWKGKKN